MHIIRAGVDSLYVAIKGTLPTAVLPRLAAAKEQAMAERRLVPFTFPDSGVEVMVAPNGATGGYALLWDTGILGATWACRQAADKLDWNFFAKPHATALLAHGFASVTEQLLQHVVRIGGKQNEHSVNRIDYAIDVRADDFELDLGGFIAHPRCQRRPHWDCHEQNQASAIFTGRRLETATIGRMPGRQVTVYDKTAEARARQKIHFFRAWGIDPADKVARVWRVELRLGKRELKERRGISTVGDLAAKLRPALADLVAQVRYVLPGSDQNVSRHRLHPIWELATAHIGEADLLGGIGHIEPAQLLRITQQIAVERYRKLLAGVAAGLGAMMDLDDAMIDCSLPDIVAEAIGVAIPTEGFRRSLVRARDKRRHIDGL
jgi:hypothetical protein